MLPPSGKNPKRDGQEKKEGKSFVGNIVVELFTT